MSKGKCVIFSAPSGSGKTTLVKHLIQYKELNLEFSVSATTRSPRDNEKHGIDYLFLSKKEFLDNIKNKKFLEFEEVYNDIFYGTYNPLVQQKLKNHNIIFDIDVEGALTLKKLFKSNALSVFVKPPSLSALKNRLINRGNENNKSIDQRLNKAKKEISKQDFFDKIIINDDLNEAKKAAFLIVKEFLD